MVTPPVTTAVGNGFTTIVMVVGVAHSPTLGVKVYVVVAVLFIAGLQDPLTPLFEVVGNGFKVPPEQIEAT